MAQNWNINPKTGDYINKLGSPEETDSLLVPAYFRLKVKQGQWLYAPDPNYGSRLFRVKKRQTNRDSSIVENLALAALKELTADGRADRITTTFDAASRHGVAIKVEIESEAGTVEEFVFNPLGA